MKRNVKQLLISTLKETASVYFAGVILVGIVLALIWGMIYCLENLFTNPALHGLTLAALSFVLIFVIDLFIQIGNDY